jgi:FKBP-type peptidyl-prolyl cis-trans isomerase (trigger factor)
MKHTIKKLPKSEVSIEVSVPMDVFEGYRQKALARIAEHVEVQGFRKGKVPATMVEQQVQPMALLEEMAEMAISETLPKILKDEKIDAVGRPAIAITKIAKGDDLEFTATVAVLPEIKLPDYKKLAAKENKEAVSTDVTDSELEEAIKELKKRRKHDEIHKSGEEHDHEAFEKLEFDANLTDEDVKMFGPFETADDFKAKFRENIKHEKIARETEKRRVATLEAIGAGTEVELPEVLVESELENLMNRLKGDIAQAGIKFEDYLTHIKKTEAEVRADMQPDAAKRAKMELIMMEIAKLEDLKPNDENVATEVKRLMETYKDADPTRAHFYIAHMLLNEEIFKFLEAQK